MNLELTDEQEFLRDAARDAFSRTRTIQAAREALEDPSARPDLWPVARSAGWPGLLVGEAGGGAGLGVFDAMLVLTEAGRVLAGVELLGHLPASALLDGASHPLTAEVAEGTKRAAFVAARPPGSAEPLRGSGTGGWTVDARSGSAREPAPLLAGDGTLTGSAAWVVDLPGADVLVVAATREDGAPVAVVVDPGAPGVTIEADERPYDATRRLGHVTFDGAAADVVEGAGAEALSGAWYIAQALVAAESLGAVETALQVTVEYAKERFTFGRAIGSYQAVKHSLVEILRQRENTYSLMVYAGWAAKDAPAEFPLAASAARAAGGHALDHAGRAMIGVHGGIGATWEHDAPLFFRRAQVTRRLLGGTGDATDRVAGELLTAAAAA